MGALANTGYTGPEITKTLNHTSIVLGFACSAIFTGARGAEFWEGIKMNRMYRRDQVPKKGGSKPKKNHKGELTEEEKSEMTPPPVQIDSAMFWFLIIDNVFQLIQIFTLSTDGTYLISESPWIFGPVLSIFGDLLLLFLSHFKWKKNYENTSVFHALKKTLDELEEKKSALEDQLFDVEQRIDDQHEEQFRKRRDHMSAKLERNAMTKKDSFARRNVPFMKTHRQKQADHAQASHAYDEKYREKIFLLHTLRLHWKEVSQGQIFPQTWR
ncbi:hypothetical protein MNV49_002454 [Pseudohyphozyma bogoriensis]|nr:hypothetical protein MNV49_002454 [Pseudohyphozyma bogoriensis]